VVSFTPRPLYRRYPLDMRLGGPQSRSGRYGEITILDPTGALTRNPPSSSPYPVAIPTELPRRLALSKFRESLINFVRAGSLKFSANNEFIFLRESYSLPWFKVGSLGQDLKLHDSKSLQVNGNH
jgi:hypothetical protein